MDIRLKFFIIFVLTGISYDNAYGQWSVNWLHRFGSSGNDYIYDIFVSENDSSRYLAVGATGVSDTPGVLHKGKQDGLVIDIRSGQLNQVEAFGGSEDDFLYGGLRYSDNLYIFWGETSSLDGNIVFHPNPGSIAGWIVFTDSSLNIISNYVVQAPNSISSTLYAGVLLGTNKIILNGYSKIHHNPDAYKQWTLIIDTLGNIILNEIETFPININIAGFSGLKLFSLDSMYFAASGKAYNDNLQIENYFHIAYYDSIQNKIIKVNSIQDIGTDATCFVSDFCNVEGEHFYLGLDNECENNLFSFQYFKIMPGGQVTHLGCHYRNMDAIDLVTWASLYLDARLRPLVVYSDRRYVYIQEGDFNGNIFYKQIFADAESGFSKAVFNLDFNAFVLVGSTYSMNGVFSNTQNHGMNDFWLAEVYMPSFSSESELSQNHQLHVYPNPGMASYTFEVSLPSSGLNTIEVVNLQGQAMPITYSLTDNLIKLQFMESISAGTYMILLNDELGVLHFSKLMILPN